MVLPGVACESQTACQASLERAVPAVAAALCVHQTAIANCCSPEDTDWSVLRLGEVTPFENVLAAEAAGSKVTSSRNQPPSALSKLDSLPAACNSSLQSTSRLPTLRMSCTNNGCLAAACHKQCQQCTCRGTAVQLLFTDMHIVLLLFQT